MLPHISNCNSNNKTKEILSSTLNSIHNLYFYLNLMKNLRASIEKGKLHQFVNDFRQTWNSSKEPNI